MVKESETEILLVVSSSRTGMARQSRCVLLAGRGKIEEILLQLFKYLLKKSKEPIYYWIGSLLFLL
jgi:hypothetical protein